MLKTSDPKTDPCGIPESRSWNIPWTLVMFTDYFRRLTYENK